MLFLCPPGAEARKRGRGSRARGRPSTRALAGANCLRQCAYSAALGGLDVDELHADEEGPARVDLFEPIGLEIVAALHNVLCEVVPHGPGAQIAYEEVEG